MNIIRIYNKDKVKLAQISISQLIRVTEIRQMVGVETVQIEAALSSAVAGYFETDGWIVDEEDRPFIIRYIYQSEVDQLAKVVAYSPHFGLTKRITRPNQGDPILTATGTADKVVKTFIRDTAPDDDEYRGLGIVCAPDRIDGPTITERTRRHILGDRIAAILAAAGRREVWSWNGGNITFDTLPVTDRTAGNPEGNSVCIFAGRFGNIENETLEIDATAEQNTVYVGGAGEGDEREVYAHGTDRKGWERCEVFVDARDVEAGDTATMEQRALQAMMDAAVTVKATAKDNTNLVFGRDYDIGDLVTVQVAYKTYEPDGPYFKPVQRYIGLKQQITQALITYNADVRTVDVTFGLTVEQQQQATGGMGSRVSNLEAAGQGGGGVQIIDSLDSDNEGAALSAKQGKVLDEKKLDKTAYEDTGWITFGTSGSGANFEDGWGPYYGYSPAVRKIGNQVHLRGLAAGGTVGGSYTMLQLPAGFRPSQRLPFLTLTNGNTYCRVDVTPDGRVVPMTGNIAWISVNNISFFVD